MNRSTYIILTFLMAFSCAAGDEAPTGKTERRFEFSYTATIKNVPEGAKTVDLWIPVPQSNEHQNISNVKISGGIFAPEINVEAMHGNKMAHWRFDSGQAKDVSVVMSVECRRKEVNASNLEKARELTDAERKDLLPFLQPNRLVLVGGAFEPIANAAIKNATGPLAIAKAAYEYTVNTLKYDKPQDKPGWGQGSTQWACDAKFGNCTDFHAMIMSINRTKGIPVKFEMGFPLPAGADSKASGSVGGYHCWAKVYLGGVGWVPLDASEAYKNPKLKDYYFGNLTADRIQFTIGRDIDLTPKQAGDPLNFFIYPYAEADGKSINVDKSFSYKDLD